MKCTSLRRAPLDLPNGECGGTTQNIKYKKLQSRLWVNQIRPRLRCCCQCVFVSLSRVCLSVIPSTTSTSLSLSPSPSSSTHHPFRNLLYSTSASLDSLSLQLSHTPYLACQASPSISLSRHKIVSSPLHTHHPPSPINSSLRHDSYFSRQHPLYPQNLGLLIAS